jgi:hypothetical protein
MSNQCLQATHKQRSCKQAAGEKNTARNNRSSGINAKQLNMKFLKTFDFVAVLTKMAPVIQIKTIVQRVSASRTWRRNVTRDHKNIPVCIITELIIANIPN